LDHETFRHRQHASLTPKTGGAPVFDWVRGVRNHFARTPALTGAAVKKRLRTAALHLRQGLKEGSNQFPVSGAHCLVRNVHHRIDDSNDAEVVAFA
jgi:hypothetical protein